jgi:fumarate reductase subunit C
MLLSVIILNAVTLSVIILNAVTLRVVAPLKVITIALFLFDEMNNEKFVDKFMASSIVDNYDVFCCKF